MLFASTSRPANSRRFQDQALHSAEWLRIYINWESIKSLTIAPNSAKIRKPWSLFVEKQGGDIVYIEPVSVAGVAGLARFGSYTTPVIIPYSSGSLRLEVEGNEGGEKEKEKEEEGHALRP